MQVVLIASCIYFYFIDKLYATMKTCLHVEGLFFDFFAGPLPVYILHLCAV